MPWPHGLRRALLAVATALAFQYALYRDEIGRYDQHVLPAFDAYVYMAMAEEPAVFTVPPWGYRILTPRLVHALPFATADGFRYLTFAGIFAAGIALYLFLRRLGNAWWAAVLGVLAFGLSGPVGQAVSYVFLADPLTLLLEILLLLALESAAGFGVLALLAVAGSLTKEVFLLFLPTIYFARRERDGDRRAAGEAVVALAAALATSAVLRSWTPYLASSSSAWLPELETFWLGVYRIVAGWRDWVPSALLGGLLPLAVLGALRPAARPFLRRYGYLLLVTLALPFAASVYTDDSRTVPFFAEDVPRLLLLALPVLVPLVLLAVDRVRPHVAAPGPPLLLPRRSEAAAAACAAALLLFPLLACDRYRRIDLRGPRDGRLVVALCRESLAFAQRLERGKPVAYAPEARRFSPGKSDPHHLERMRWFLREGWGPMPQYGMGSVVMQAPQATLILPCLRPAEWEITVTLSAPRETRFSVDVNGQAVGEAGVGREPVKQRLRIPASALFRGDNRLTLAAPGDDEGVRARLHELVVRPVATSR